MDSNYIIFECHGDAAKNIIATAVVSSIKKHYPKKQIVVVTQFAEIWLHNPDVYRVYAFGHSLYFYDDYIAEKDSLIFRHDPYQTEDFAYNRKHIIEIWCDLCGVPYSQTQPSLHFTWREKEAIGRLTASDKPLFFIQTNRPGLPENISHFWPTDLPISIAQEVTDVMNARGYMTIHLRSAHQPMLKNATSLTLDFRQTLCAFLFSKARLFIDSYAHHTATALNLPSVVTYITGTPSTFGYTMHHNMEAKADAKLHEYITSYKEGFEATPDILECPFSLEKIFDAEEIVLALENLEKK